MASITPTPDELRAAIQECFDLLLEERERAAAGARTPDHDFAARLTDYVDTVVSERVDAAVAAAVAKLEDVTVPAQVSKEMEQKVHWFTKLATHPIKTNLMQTPLAHLLPESILPNSPFFMMPFKKAFALTLNNGANTMNHFAHVHLAIKMIQDQMLPIRPEVERPKNILKRESSVKNGKLFSPKSE